jgi:hypothetical protein
MADPAAHLARLCRADSQAKAARVLAAEIGGAADPDIASRVSQLKQALFDAQEALTRRAEELEAARQINRELMARLNRDS